MFLLGIQLWFPESQWRRRDERRPIGMRRMPSSCCARFTSYAAFNIARVCCKGCYPRTHLLCCISRRQKSVAIEDEDGGLAIDVEDAGSDARANQVDSLFELADSCCARRNSRVISQEENDSHIEEILV